jgi:hypothetical protein
MPLIFQLIAFAVSCNSLTERPIDDEPLRRTVAPAVLDRAVFDADALRQGQPKPIHDAALGLCDDVVGLYRNARIQGTQTCETRTLPELRSSAISATTLWSSGNIVHARRRLRCRAVRDAARIAATDHLPR